MDVFSRRFQYRIGSGLYDRQLYLHDYDQVAEDAQHRRDPDADREREHASQELSLRHQVRVAITQSVGGRGAGTLPEGPRAELADLYAQVRNPLAPLVRQETLNWLMPVMPLAGQSIVVPEPLAAGIRQYEPNVSRLAMWACVVLMDYVEVHYQTLSASAKTDFSRDLNTRLSNGGSPWSFDLGRWMRPGWPRERDTGFDRIVHALWSESDTALARRVNEVLGPDYQPGQSHGPDGELARVEASNRDIKPVLKQAAGDLAHAERLLLTDPKLEHEGHTKAIAAARSAFDQCATSYPGSVGRPFMRYKPPPGRRSRFAAPPRTARSRMDAQGGPGTRRAPQQFISPSEGARAAHRLMRLAEYAAGDSLVRPGGASAATRETILKRMPFAEFLVRLVVMSPSENEAEEYARVVRMPSGSKLEIKVDDGVLARLVIDMMAHLGIYAARADTMEVKESPGLLPDAADMPDWLVNSLAVGWMVLKAGVLLGIGFAIGVLAARMGLI